MLRRAWRSRDGRECRAPIVTAETQRAEHSCDSVRRAIAHRNLVGRAVDVVREGNGISGIIVESKSGRHAILAKRIIDATGDGMGNVLTGPTSVAVDSFGNS